MATWIYNNIILRRHPLTINCLSTLNEVSNGDYPGTNYFDSNIECMDLDSYEQHSKGESKKTVDAVIGISDCDNKKLSNPRLLCVELRMGYESTHNFSSAFADKIIHSKDLLGGHIAIELGSLFIFSDALAPKAKSWIKNRQRAGAYKYMLSCGVSDFCNIIKSIDELPYQPINDEKIIREKLANYELHKDWQSYFNEIQNFCKLTCRYQYKMPYEYKFMVNLLKEVWTDLRSEHVSFEDDDNELLAEILEDEFSFLVA